MVAHLHWLEVSLGDELIQDTYLGVQGACICKMVAVAELNKECTNR